MCVMRISLKVAGVLEKDFECNANLLVCRERKSCRENLGAF